MTRYFKLHWCNPNTGDEFTANHSYDGGTGQEKHSFHGWKMRCIAAGKSGGFVYLGSTNGL